MIYDNSQLIIDTRNVFDGKNGDHLRRLGQGEIGTDNVLIFIKTWVIK